MSTTRKYAKKPKDTSKGETPFNEIRITGTDYVGKYITYAASLLLEGKETEPDKPKEKIDKIVLKATGIATKGACLVAEILKHRIFGLHQLNKIETITVFDEYEPLEEGLDHIKIERKLAVFEITLSTKDGVLDTKAPGYQAPLPKNEVQEEDLTELLKRRGEGRYERRGSGRGGRRGGRGGRRGSGGRRRGGDGYRGERRDDGYRERRDDGYREKRDDGYRGERRDDGYRGEKRDDGYREKRDDGYREKREDGYREKRDDGYRGERRDDGYRGERRDDGYRERRGGGRGERRRGERRGERRGDGERRERGDERRRGDRGTDRPRTEGKLWQ